MRTTIEDVKDIIDTELDDSRIERHMTTANVLVDSNLAGRLSEEELTEIETWLAAHYIALTSERVAKKEGAGGASIEYAGEFGAGLSATQYGQVAIALDASGTLASLGGKQVSMKSL